MVLVSGEGGIGKSTLVEHMLAPARQGGTPVVVSRAVSDVGVPELWMWRRVLEQTAQRGLGDATADLVALEEESEFDPTAAIRFRAFEGTVGALRSAARHSGLIVALEDLQWADAASLDLLRHLCGEVAAHGCWWSAPTASRTAGLGYRLGWQRSLDRDRSGCSGLLR